MTDTAQKIHNKNNNKYKTINILNKLHNNNNNNKEFLNIMTTSHLKFEIEPTLKRRVIKYN